MSTYRLQPQEFKATLILSSPRILTDQVKRSHLYDFQPEMVYELQNIVLNSVKQGSNPMLASLTQPQNVMSSAIIPDGSGLKMITSQFSDYWSFYLIIDNLSFNLNKTMSIAGLQNTNRMVISGFCSEEPINPIDHGNNITINPMSILTPTHYIHFNLTNMGGDNPPIIKFQQSHDIVINTAVNHLIKPNIQTDLSMLRPHDYSLSTGFPEYNEITGNYDDIHFIDNNTLLNGDTNPIINTSLNVPKMHLANILNTSIKAAYRFTNNNLSIADSIYESAPMDQRYTSEFDRTNQSRNAEIVNQYVFDPSQPVSFNQLTQLFPYLQIIPLFIPKECAWNVVSQETINPPTVYTSIVASALPTIMSRFNLSECMFRYSSWVNNPDGTMGTYEVKHFATHIAVPSHIAAGSWHNFIHAIETEIFPVLLHRIGHFDIFISCQSIGYVQIDLHALDHDSMYEQGVYETYNFLGGINTPLVGTLNHHQANEKELLKLTSTLGHNIGDFLTKTAVAYPSGY
jgi:hypothetical protein